eukprot:s3326_g8.t1
MATALEGFVDESLILLLGNLRAQEIAAVAATGSRLRSVAVSNPVWDGLCGALWQGRAVLHRFTELRRIDAREAYRQSLEDSRRTNITRGELLSIDWSFRFKASAGEGWQAGDPWWQGQEATRVRFKKNGRAAFKRGPLFGSRPPVLRWRFVRFPARTHQALNRTTGRGSADFSEFGRRGIRAKVMGREVPTYCVRRNKHNWGWTMESCWVVWSSWPMPRKDSPEAELLEDERLPVSFDVQEDQAMAFNNGYRRVEQEEETEADGDSEPDAEDSVVVPAEWRSGEGEAEEPEDDSEPVSEEEQEEPSNEQSPRFVIVRIGDHLIRLPRALIDSSTPEMLEEMLRRSLERISEQ